MGKGYAVECCARKYLTKWSGEQCCAFLSRRNVFDTFEYEFRRDGELVIVFLWKQGTRQCDYRRLNIKYRVSLQMTDGGTMIELSYIADDRYPRGLLDADLDEFFRVKLDALPC